MRAIILTLSALACVDAFSTALETTERTQDALTKLLLATAPIQAPSARKIQRNVLMRGGEKVTGAVKWFDSEKGYGFIERDDGEGDVFVHQTSIYAKGFRSLAEGEEVEFNVVEGNNGKLAAADVTGPGGEYVQGAPKPERNDDDMGGGSYGMDDRSAPAPPPRKFDLEELKSRPLPEKYASVTRSLGEDSGLSQFDLDKINSRPPPEKYNSVPKPAASDDTGAGDTTTKKPYKFDLEEFMARPLPEKYQIKREEPEEPKKPMRKFDLEEFMARPLPEKYRNVVSGQDYIER